MDSDASGHARRSGRIADWVAQPIAYADDHVRPFGPGLDAPAAERGVSLAHEAGHAQVADVHRINTVGATQCLRDQRGSTCPSETSSKVDFRGVTHSNATPGACARMRAKSRGKRSMAMSGNASRTPARSWRGRRFGADRARAPTPAAAVHPLGEVERVRGRPHRAARLDQQRVAQLLAQPSECMTDRPLRSPQLLCGTGDVALGHEHLEDNEEVQVRTAKIELVHGP